MSAQLKEVVVDANPLQLKDLSTYPGYDFLHLGARSYKRAFLQVRTGLSGGRQGLTIYFAIGTQGQIIYGHKSGRYHVPGQFLL